MVDIQRLARSVLFLAIGLLLGGVSVIAFADEYPAQAWWILTNSSGGNPNPEKVASTPSATCALASSHGNYTDHEQVSIEHYYLCQGKVGTTGYTYARVYPYTLCPWGGGLVGDLCVDAPPCETGERNLDGSCFTCPEGRTWNGTTCVSKCEAGAGRSAGTADSWVTVDLDTVPSGNPTFCIEGCLVKGTRTECTGAESATSGGDYIQIGQLCQIQGPFVQTGGSCTPGTGSTPNFVDVEQEGRQWWDTGKDGRDCVESGGQPGEVNGVSVCVRPQPDETWDTKTETSSDSTETTTQNPDGTVTETTTTTSTSTSGGTSTTTTTTTTTTKDANGDTISSGTKTETKQEPVTDFCAKNPKDPACVGQTSGGSVAGMKCEETFKCSGDALQCAVLQLARVEHCEALEMAQDNALTELAGQDWAGVADITAEQEERALNRDGAFDFDLGQTWMDSKQEYVTFTKECINVPPIDILGTRIEFDVGVLCDVGAVLRLFMHLLAYLGAIRMIVAKV